MPRQNHRSDLKLTLSRSLLGSVAVVAGVLGCGETYPDLFSPLDYPTEQSSAAEQFSEQATDRVEDQLALQEQAVTMTTALGSGSGVQAARAADAASEQDAGVGASTGTVSSPDAGSNLTENEAAITRPSPNTAQEPEPPIALPPDQRPLSDGSCAASCQWSGGRCAQGVCVFDCDATGDCQRGQTVCPPGSLCSVRCGEGACADNIVCRDDATCDIECVGRDSCAQQVICEGNCNVVCSGENSCAGGVSSSVQALNLVCSGAGSCGQRVQCAGQDCEIDCRGEGSCSELDIFARTNRLSCSGLNACAQGIYCSGASCQIDCSEQSCTSGVVCEAISCSDQSH